MNDMSRYRIQESVARSGSRPSHKNLNPTGSFPLKSEEMADVLVIIECVHKFWG